MQDAGRDQMQDELVFADHDRMTRVVPPLIARDDVRALGQEINDLSFSFIAPLGADND
jgi:hypothetical protein